MAAKLVYLEAGERIISIVCKTILDDRKDARAQRNKLILKKEIEDNGRRAMVSLEADFSTEQEMTKCALEWSKLSGTSITKEVVCC